MSDNGAFDRPEYREQERPWKEDKEYRKEKYDTLQALKSLESSDDKIRVSEVKISHDLDEIRASLKAMVQKYPGDKDFVLLSTLYGDLHLDYKDKADLKFDLGFDVLVEEMEYLIQSLGIKKVGPEQMQDHPQTAQAILDLKAKGVIPSYIQKSNNPDARPVVLFMQSHIGSRSTVKTQEDLRLEKAAGVELSQAQIAGAVRSGAVNSVFLEGLPSGRLPVDEEFLKKIKGSPEWESMSDVERVAIEKAAKGGFQMRGYEMTSTQEYKEGKFLPYRTTAQNVFIASAVANGLDSNLTGLPAVVIGAGHESPSLGSSRKILPISEVLAAYGMDVIVVDASTPYVDQKEIRVIAEERSRQR